MEERYCQSCGMPLGSTNEVLGTNKDGSKNEEYCIYCYDKGEFTFDGTMDEMIEICVPHMTSDGQMKEEEARNMMKQFFPTLKRWK